MLRGSIKAKTEYPIKQHPQPGTSKAKKPNLLPPVLFGTSPIPTMYRPAALAALLSFAASVSAQQVGTNTAETHPALTWYKCTSPSACTAQNGKITLDANWRWTHLTTGYTNCYTGNAWDTSVGDGASCAQKCALDGADYSGTYGITTSGNALTLKFVTPNSNGKNVGSRVYLMSDDSTYNVFKMLGQEISFDVELSGLPCGLNGAVYFSEMAADGGMSAYPNNKAGAKYGTGYCDSQCPRDLKFINGEVCVEVKSCLLDTVTHLSLSP